MENKVELLKITNLKLEEKKEEVRKLKKFKNEIEIEIRIEEIESFLIESRERVENESKNKWLLTKIKILSEDLLSYQKRLKRIEKNKEVD